MKLFDDVASRPAVPSQYLDQSLLNEYGEECVPVVVWQAEGRQVLRYRCLADMWSEAFEAWINALKAARDAPQPMPAGHCMFVNPEQHGAVKWGQDDDYAA